jgi:SAM-dependent methyltransferase
MIKQEKDNYVYDMDWSQSGNGFNSFLNYRRYQFNLIKNYLGKNILEIGTGDRSFTQQISINCKHNYNLLSTEPSPVLFDLFKNQGKFTDNFEFISMDLFDMNVGFEKKFDTVLMIHVLEHIKEDKRAIDHTHTLLNDGGHLLIQVPAYQWLFSDHDVSIGHHRRYNKKSISKIIDSNKYKIVRIWHQDPIGILGSFLFFKIMKTKLKSKAGNNLLCRQGVFYDRFIIPFEQFIEKYIDFPIGLNLTLVLKKL